LAWQVTYTKLVMFEAVREINLPTFWGPLIVLAIRAITGWLAFPLTLATAGRRGFQVNAPGGTIRGQWMCIFSKE
jgi:hypothetical protein